MDHSIIMELLSKIAFINKMDYYWIITFTNSNLEFQKIGNQILMKLLVMNIVLLTIISHKTQYNINIGYPICFLDPKVSVICWRRIV